MTKVFITGGAGYIGSHTILDLLESNHAVVVLDNLSNSSIESLTRVEKLTGKSVTFYEGDIRDRSALQKIFKEQPDIEAVIHFAALKAVGESNEIPLAYYQNNVAGTVTLLEELATANIKKFVFSSSATVYGDPASVPITESFPTSATNPYGQTKLMVEHILTDLVASDPEWSVSILRYFNPVGAHESGLIGEDPNGIPNNLMPFIQQVAIGKRDQLSVFGNDYDTHDGTGIRDYIHVVDLANGHLKALNKIMTNKGLHIHNLGTGQGYSVLEMVTAFEKVTGKSIPYQVVARRQGDIAECWAQTNKSEKELGWKANLGLTDMVESAWNWQENNPNGLKSNIGVNLACKLLKAREIS
ncbi:UDP-glucose 4-epimerase GalE [Psychrosphaera haliotis]|uniref:UDP-glucose 4-epimerase n=1 Tax=Psychrosphaera haliotis TaxID=555083 RepID=A0A6N8FAE2_9GAMM|nr:UDP-glucose 4-epimerase GalE [Psychrosphaera haliotis]MUH71391.1 UDP-glucose 4-epimerase GalE [Psychrosphaera haliotis]